MKEVLPFNDNPECPKCLTMSPLLQFCWLTDGREYLKVTCEECGYTWNMETADKDKKELILEEKIEVKVNGEDEETKLAPVEEKE